MRYKTPFLINFSHKVWDMAIEGKDLRASCKGSQNLFYGTNGSCRFYGPLFIFNARTCRVIVYLRGLRNL